MTQGTTHIYIIRQEEILHGTYNQVISYPSPRLEVVLQHHHSESRDLRVYQV